MTQPTYEELALALVRAQNALKDFRDNTSTDPAGLCIEEVKYEVVDPILDALGIGCGYSEEYNRTQLAKFTGTQTKKGLE